jgi:hypothetical protein
VLQQVIDSGCDMLGAYLGKAWQTRKIEQRIYSIILSVHDAFSNLI